MNTWPPSLRPGMLGSDEEEEEEEEEEEVLVCRWGGISFTGGS